MNVLPYSVYTWRTWKIAVGIIIYTLETSHIIAMLSKQSKDLSQCSSYKQAALLNVDLKLYSKILANRLLHLAQIIHTDQLVYPPMWSMGQYHQGDRVIYLIHQGFSAHASGHWCEEACWLLMVIFTFHTLLGLRTSMLSWISTLYSSPQAAV